MSDPIDRAQAREQELRDAALAEHRRGRIIGDADPIGEAGACIDCGDAIDPARLAALPRALRCIDCQHDKERHR